jgi:hypothetical protein
MSEENKPNGNKSFIDESEIDEKAMTENEYKQAVERFTSLEDRLREIDENIRALYKEKDEAKSRLCKIHRELELEFWREAKRRHPHSLVFVRRLTGGAVTFGDDAAWLHENQSYATAEIQWGDFTKTVDPTFTERDGTPELLVPEGDSHLGTIEQAVKRIGTAKMHQTWQDNPVVLLTLNPNNKDLEEQ